MSEGRLIQVLTEELVVDYRKVILRRLLKQHLASNEECNNSFVIPALAQIFQSLSDLFFIDLPMFFQYAGVIPNPNNINIFMNTLCLKLFLKFSKILHYCWSWVTLFLCTEFSQTYWVSYCPTICFLCPKILKCSVCYCINYFSPVGEYCITPL